MIVKVLIGGAASVLPYMHHCSSRGVGVMVGIDGVSVRRTDLEKPSPLFHRGLDFYQEIVWGFPVSVLLISRTV